jgi:acyl-CoA synthetase (AMP-forming)/AMP-acid ligase II
LRANTKISSWRGAADHPAQHDLVTLLTARAREWGAREALSCLTGDVHHAASATFGELDIRARAIAVALSEKIEDCRGRRALLVFQPGLDFVAAYLGCLYAGAIAVPTYAPHPAQFRRSLDRYLGIVKDADPDFLLTTQAYRLPVAAMRAAWRPLRNSHCIETDELSISRLAQQWHPPLTAPDSVAFLQYTSGSTSAPKGVMVTHGNLIHNLEAIKRLAADIPAPRGVSWLPPYHDMGLIGGILQPLYAGFPCALISPFEFLQRPVFWLEAMTHFRATVSPLPNFALELCLRKITDEQLAKLDLSHWRTAINGSEPIRKETLDRFTARFSACGFRAQAHKPVYGLAEVTLMASCEYRPVSARSLDVSSKGIGLGRVAPPEGEADRRSVVSCGRPIEEHEIAIVDPETRHPCPDGIVGEIWIRGPSVASGYWNKPLETAATFGARIADTDTGPFLRTGDLGFLHGGELFVTGRRKDLIIIGGKNYYPQDIEQAAECSHPAIRVGSSAAFGVDQDLGEAVVVVVEVDGRRYQRWQSSFAGTGRRSGLAVSDAMGARPLLRDEVSRGIRDSVRQHVGVDLAGILLVKPGFVPKTSSGKVQRARCKQMFQEGRLEEI